jgi:hypothetical protein
VVRKLLCSFGLISLRSHVCAGVSFGDMPLSLCGLCVAMNERVLPLDDGHIGRNMQWKTILKSLKFSDSVAYKMVH